MMWSAAILGLAGNLHCLGMCGPITMILPLSALGGAQKTLAVLIYNAGRLLTYVALGLAFGLLGQGIMLADLHQHISVAVGALMVLGILLPLALSSRWKRKLNDSRWMNFLRAQIRRLLKTRHYGGYFLLGVMNGMLPCGLVYVAIAGALVTGDVVNGALYMLLFGLGTLPVMIAMPLIGQAVNNLLKARARFVLPGITLLVGVFFIVRGLGLSIPYISPHEDAMKIEVAEEGEETPPAPKHSCH